MSEKDTTASPTPTPAPSPMELVLQFHHTYSVPIRPFSDPTLDYERMNMRMSLIAEEFAELMGAVYGRAHARSSKPPPPRPSPPTRGSAMLSRPPTPWLTSSMSSMAWPSSRG